MLEKERAADPLQKLKLLVDRAGDVSEVASGGGRGDNRATAVSWEGVLSNQSVYVQQIEKENMYLKKQLYDVKSKLVETVQENQQLLRVKAVAASYPTTDISCSSPDAFLVQIKEQYVAKCNRLETELKLLRSTLATKEEMLEERGGGIDSANKYCIVCKQNAAVLKEDEFTMLDKVIRERDLLLKQVASLQGEIRIKNDDMETTSERFEALRKEGEEGELEKAQLMIRIDSQRREIDALIEQLNDAKDSYEKRLCSTVDRLQTQMGDQARRMETEHEGAMKRIGEVEVKERRLMREEQRLMKALEDSRSEVVALEQQMIQMKNESDFKLRKQQFEKENAVAEVVKLKSLAAYLKKEKAKLADELSTVSNSLNERISSLERDLTKSQESYTMTLRKMSAVSSENERLKSAQASVSDQIRCESDRLLADARAQRDQIAEEIRGLLSRHETSVTQHQNIIGNQTTLIEKLKNQLAHCLSRNEKLSERLTKERQAMRLEIDGTKERCEQLMRLVSDANQQQLKSIQMQSALKQRIKEQQ